MLVEIVLDGIDGVDVPQVVPEVIHLGSVFGRSEHLHGQAVNDKRRVQQDEPRHVIGSLSSDHGAHRTALALPEQEHVALVDLGKLAYGVEHGGQVGRLGLDRAIGRFAGRARLDGAAAEIERVSHITPRCHLASVAAAIHVCAA